MLTTCTDANKVVSQGSVVQYSVSPEMATVNGETVAVWYTITRTRTEAYSYIGLTRAAAESSADTIRKSLTRKYAQWIAELADTEGAAQAVVTIIPVNVYQCTSQVFASPMSGEMWQVSVNVNDTDVIISLNEPTSDADIDQLFQEAANRDTPTGTAKIMITGASWNSGNNYVNVKYSTLNIDNFSSNLVTAEKLVDGQWVDAQAASKTDTSLHFSSTDNVTFRLSYNNTIHSEQFTTHDKRRATVEIVSATASMRALYGIYIEAIVRSPDLLPSALSMFVNTQGASRATTSQVTISDRSGDLYVVGCYITGSVPHSITFGLAEKGGIYSSVNCNTYVIPDMPYMTIDESSWEVDGESFSLDFKSNHLIADLRQFLCVEIVDEVGGAFNSVSATITSSTVGGETVFTASGTLPSLVASAGRYTAKVYLVFSKDNQSETISNAIIESWNRPIRETTTFKFSGISELTFHGTVTPQTDTTFDVDWGDGNVTTGCTSSTSLTHDYGDSGNYEVKVIGNILSFTGNSLNKMFNSANNNLSEISFANTVTSLGTVAGIFARMPGSDVSSLAKVVGYGIATVPAEAFKNHLSLSTVTLPSLSSCGADAFASQNGLACTVDFSGDTYFHFRGKDNWSFGIRPLSTIKFSDQTITLAE